MTDNMLREKLRVERDLLGDAHPLVVESFRVYPTAHPSAFRDVSAVRENPTDLIRHKAVRPSIMAIADRDSYWKVR